LPGQPSPSRNEMLFSKKLVDHLGVKRRVDSEISQNYKDLAAAAQQQLEKALMHLVKTYVQRTGIGKVCMAGGVALNCLANQKIKSLEEVEDLFIQPASSDAGISLGAAYLACAEENIPVEKMTHVFLGISFSDDEIESTLTNCGVDFRKTKNVIEEAATALAANKVIGWFQGNMEFGPRALGNRSILANPSAENIQSIVNRKVKFRESYRPFGASVLQSHFHTYFNAACTEAPFMTKVFDVNPEYQDSLKGVTHEDGTCRVQSVNAGHLKYFELLSSFEKKTGLGVLLNTSFNLNHEPIVSSPRDAVASFFGSGLDLLFIGNFVVTKSLKN
jgi:carbamoyltransferase